MRILVLAVDRDDDIGVKAGVKTPVVGERKVFEAAKKLILADPEDSDSNTIFYALKIYKELKRSGKDVDVAVVSGSPSLGSLADMRIRDQVEMLVKERNIGGIYFVSDGAEDEQIIPVLLSVAPIISKKTVFVKQAKELEKTYYVIKEALRDPFLSRLLLGMPGFILVLWVFLGDLGLRVVGGLLGLYLIIKGFGAEEPLIRGVKSILSGITLRNVSAPTYILSLSLFLMAFYFSGMTFMYYPDEHIRFYEGARIFIGFASLSGATYLAGRILDAHVYKKAYKIGKYISYSASVLVFWAVFDVLLQILEVHANFFDLIVTFVASTFFYVIVYRFSAIFHESIISSEKVRGCPVYSKRGDILGRIEKVENGKVFLTKGMEIPSNRIHIEDGRLYAVL